MFVKFNPAKHLYGRGWLGLIPLVGAFVGLGLIILGVFKYNDKKLMLIGTAAFLFTVFVYGSMYYYFEYSERARKDYSVFAQPDMNNLIKSIEFYKTENGFYPDSLEELTVSDKLVPIKDPILFGKPEVNHRNYYYKKVGKKYYLFSSGIDKIPFTSDDIFPSAKYYDSTKTGLILPIK